MSQNFSDMPLDKQMDLAAKLGEELKKCEIDTTVDIYREEVCQLTTDKIIGKTELKINKSLPSSKKENVNKFKAAIKELTEGIDGLSIAVNSVVGAGDMYQTIEDVTTIEDATKPVKIEHKEGTVMMVDFWATWCPPCQKPMQHNEDMLKEHGEKWGDRVKIIGLSIDQDAPTVVNHVNNKDWKRPTHYHRAKSNCSDVYSVRGVPHVLIVDTKGKIVFKGHPANRKDLVQDFNDLLEGKTLTGEGCESSGAKAEGDGEKEGDAPSVTQDTISAQMSEMDKFKTTGEELQKELKEKATGMMRNFCVITLQASYKPDRQTWTSEYTNHRVLVGPEGKVDECQKGIEAKMGTKDKDNRMGWTFELNEQFHKQ